MAFALSSARLPAQQPAEDSGEFNVTTATHELIDGRYQVDAFVYFRLPSRAAAALHDGLPLTIRFEIEILRRRAFWWDTAEFPRVSQRWQLSYISLTDRYLVHNINISRSQSFPTLQQALDHMGKIDDMHAIDATLLDDDRRYLIRVRAVLDKEEMLGPMRFAALLLPDWSIESRWVEWDLVEE